MNNRDSFRKKEGSEFNWNSSPTNNFTGSEVYFIIYTGGSGDAFDSAKTRIEQIKKSKNYNENVDKIYYLEIYDLGKLEEEIEKRIKEANEKGYGKTAEVSFFGHGGVDGPVGIIRASKYNLEDITDDPRDRGQLIPTGWKEIDFNFDPNGSFAVFYGCNTLSFAEEFLHLQPNVKFSTGIDGDGGGSLNETKFISNWHNYFDRPSFFGSSSLWSMEKDIFSRDPRYKVGVSYNNIEGDKIEMRRATVVIVGNVTIEKIENKLKLRSEEKCNGSN